MKISNLRLLFWATVTVAGSPILTSCSPSAPAKEEVADAPESPAISKPTAVAVPSTPATPPVTSPRVHEPPVSEVPKASQAVEGHPNLTVEEWDYFAKSLQCWSFMKSFPDMASVSEVRDYRAKLEQAWFDHSSIRPVPSRLENYASLVNDGIFSLKTGFMKYELSQTAGEAGANMAEQAKEEIRRGSELMDRADEERHRIDDGR